MLASICSAQKLATTPASMSSSHQKLEYITAGNSHSGELVLIEKSGKILIYDGYEVSPWKNRILPLLAPPTSLFLRDSLLYFTTKDALLVYDPETKNPRLLQHASDQFLLEKDDALYYFADSVWFELSNGKLKKISTPYKERNNFPTFIELNTEESIRLQNGMILWLDSDDRIISMLDAPKTSSLLVDSWNQVWIIQKNKLKRLDLIREAENKVEYFWNNQAPLSITRKDNTTLAIYPGNQVVRWNGTTPKVLWSAISQPISLFIDDKQGCWIVTKDQLSYASDENKFTWQRDLIKIQGTVVSILNDGQTISVVTKNNGIVQTRVQAEQEEWIWVPYRYNHEIKNLQIIEAATRDKTYLFSETFGIFILNKQEVSILAKNFPSMGILSVALNERNVFLMDKGKRFHRFDFGPKSIYNFPSETSLPEPANYDFFRMNDRVIYETDQGLCVANPDDGTYETFITKASLKNSIIRNNHLFDFGIKPSIFQIPSSPQSQGGPRIVKVSVKTKSGKIHSLTNTVNESVKLTNEDFPIQLEAFCVFIDDPKRIEYAWKTIKDKIIQDFQFSNAVKLSLDDVFEENLQLVTKVEGAISQKQLNRIEISYLAKKEDYRWAIYLSVLLAALLLVIILFNKWRSQNQKRKIQTLKLEKKALELEQKALQLQLNPHFVFNALNGVKGMIALGDQKKARQYLTKISSLMRTMLNDARTDKISIASEVNMLKSYLEIEQELRGFPWKYEVILAESVNDQLLIPPMMVQPFVENAIIHAFPQKTSDGLISVRFSRKGPKIQITIEDNGVGLQNKTSTHQSIALQLIQDRLKHLNKGTKQTDFSLKNKSDHDVREHGVKITILLPILS